MSDTTSGVDWPSGFDRTAPSDREPYPHNFRVGRRQAFENILEELDRMDARNVRIESGAVPGNSNLPRANATPRDPGVVAYFERDGRTFAVPCDRWDNLRDNAQAIAKYLNAKRALERYGVETIESEMTTHIHPSGTGGAARRGRSGTDSGAAPGATPDWTLRYCPTCGADVSEYAAPSYCPECGTELPDRA